MRKTWLSSKLFVKIPVYSPKIYNSSQRNIRRSEAHKLIVSVILPDYVCWFVFSVHILVLLLSIFSSLPLFLMIFCILGLVISFLWIRQLYTWVGRFSMLSFDALGWIGHLPNQEQVNLRVAARPWVTSWFIVLPIAEDHLQQRHTWLGRALWCRIWPKIFLFSCLWNSPEELRQLRLILLSSSAGAR